MAQPLPYERDFDFEFFQSQHPVTPLPGDKVNLEFDQVAETFDQVLDRIRRIQRDDLALASKSVGYDQLKDEVSLGFNPPTAWETGVAYIRSDSVFADNGFYRCIVSHTSGDFEADLAVGKWELAADFTSATTEAQAAQAAAEAARDAAITAKNGAESARDVAVGASAAAGTSADNAALSAGTATSAAATATGARDAALAAQSGAESARDSAVVAKNDAQAAAAAADASADAAAISEANAAATLAGALVKTNNLSDVTNAATARNNLGAGDMLASNNLSDVSNKATGRANLGVTAAIDALGITYVNLANFCACDGTTDDSAAFQAAIDANKGKTLVLPDDKVLLAAGIYLNGSSYNGTKLIFRGEFKLKPAASIGTNNGFGQVYSGIEVRDCEVEINGRFDGNRAAQQDREQTIVITVSGGKLHSREKLIFREIRGDGIYITQKDYNTLSADPEFDLAYVYGANSADDGRNLISVISCARGTIDTFISRNVGGVVGGSLMPGGLDCEPNYSGQKVRNLTIGLVDIVGAGSSNLQVYGARFSDATHTTPETNASLANINISVARVINTCAAGAADEFTNVTQTNNSCCVIEGVVGVTIGYLDTEFTTAYGDALIVRNGAANITIKGRAKKVKSVLLGTGVSGSERGCKNLNIHFDMDDISRFGHAVGVIEGGRLSGRLTGPKTAYYSNRFAVHTLPPSGTGSLTNVELAHEIPGDANWTRSYRHSSGMTYPGTVINGAKLPSGSWAAEVNRIGDMPVSRANCPGVNDMSSIPTGGTWVAGDRVRNNNSATVGTTSNWVRLTNGAAHVSGTDWKLIA